MSNPTPQIPDLGRALFAGLAKQNGWDPDPQPRNSKPRSDLEAAIQQHYAQTTHEAPKEN